MKRNRYGLFRSRFLESVNLPALPAALAICRAWNTTHAIGQPVRVLRATGKGMTTTTRRRAEVMEGRPAVWVEGASGYVELQHVRAL